MVAALRNGGNITVNYDMKNARGDPGHARHTGSPGETNGTSVDPQWRAAAIQGLASLSYLPAPLYEGRTEFDSFGPLEWAANASQVATMMTAVGSRPVLPFLEPRDHPILYLRAVPDAWATRSPDWDGAVFRGARKDEYFMLQIGLVTTTSGFLLEHSGCVFTALTHTSDQSAAAIPASALSSPNVGGNNSRGLAFTRAMNVSSGHTGVLWVGIAVPTTAAAGNYSGTVSLTLHLRTQTPTTHVLSLPLTVEVLPGPPAKAHGDLDGASLSRSRWLDSTEGIE